jgi:hypothetical protein
MGSQAGLARRGVEVRRFIYRVRESAAGRSRPESTSPVTPVFRLHAVDRCALKAARGSISFPGVNRAAGVGGGGSTSFIPVASSTSRISLIRRSPYHEPATPRPMKNGVAAAGPTSTDFPGTLNAVNLNWSAAVLDGGRKVVYTKVGGGTGNFADFRHSFGFTIHARGAVNGTVSLATQGFSRDESQSLDLKAPQGAFDLWYSIRGLVRLGKARFGLARYGMAWFGAAWLGCQWHKGGSGTTRAVPMPTSGHEG